MKVPAELKPACWGAAGGAAALALIGFTWGGWVTATTSETEAKERAAAAVASVLAPICAENFRHDADATAKLVELKETRSWQRAEFLEKGGWATMPGKDTPTSGVARACAEILTSES